MINVNNSNSFHASMSQTRMVLLNNRELELPTKLADSVEEAKTEIRCSPYRASFLPKEIVLDSKILLELVNDAKLFYSDAPKWQYPLDIELCFCKNKNLSKEESRIVENTLLSRKLTIDSALSERNFPYFFPPAYSEPPVLVKPEESLNDREVIMEACRCGVLCE